MPPAPAIADGIRSSQDEIPAAAADAQVPHPAHAFLADRPRLGFQTGAFKGLADFTFKGLRRGLCTENNKGIGNEAVGGARRSR